MGGAFTAIANDPSGYYWNPAGLTQVNDFAIQFEHVPVFGGLAQYNTANIVLSLADNLAMSVSWIRLGVDDIPRYGSLEGSRYDRLTKSKYRSDGQAEGYFSDNEDAVLVSFSQSQFFDLYFGGGVAPIIVPVELSLGVTGKYVRQKLDANLGTGQGLDAGVLLKFTSIKFVKDEPRTWLGFGVNARDLTRTSIVWDTASKHKDQIKVNFQTGVAFSHLLQGLRTRFTCSLDQELGMYDDIHGGAEIEFFHVLALRAGYYREDFTAGAGLSFLGLSIDYAFIPHELDNTHRISGAFHF
jgi:hypothetical protein